MPKHRLNNREHRSECSASRFRRAFVSSQEHGMWSGQRASRPEHFCEYGLKSRMVSCRWAAYAWQCLLPVVLAQLFDAWSMTAAKSFLAWTSISIRSTIHYWTRCGDWR